jgi:hypothetical protein
MTLNCGSSADSWGDGWFEFAESCMAQGNVYSDGPAVHANPFFASAAPPTGFLAWCAIWIAITLALSVVSLTRSNGWPVLATTRHKVTFVVCQHIWQSPNRPSP